MDSLLTLLQQAEAARDAAEVALQRTLAALQQARTQQAQLEQYRAEYEARYAEQFARGASIDIVRCYQGFAQRLAQAIEQQAQAVRAAEGRVDAAREPLRQAELQVASIRKLIERRSEELRLKEQRREQRQTDESAARATGRGLSMFGAIPSLRGA
jgi:flagellar FliJ protein